MIGKFNQEYREGLWKYQFIQDYFNGVIGPEEFFTELNRNEVKISTEGFGCAIPHLREFAVKDPDTRGYRTDVAGIVEEFFTDPSSMDKERMRIYDIVLNRGLANGNVGVRDFVRMQEPRNIAAVQFLAAMCMGPEAEIVKPESITEDTELPLIKDSWYGVRKGGLGVFEGKLVPIVPKMGKNIPLAPLLDPIEHLTHRGMVVGKNYDKKEEYNNLENMLRHGVFGRKDIPTYFTLPGHRVETYGEGKHQVYIWIDRDKLLEKRNIFMDPETIGKTERCSLTGDQEGGSYFTVGGIPTDAIAKFDVLPNVKFDYR